MFFLFRLGQHVVDFIVLFCLGFLHRYQTLQQLPVLPLKLRDLRPLSLDLHGPRCTLRYRHLERVAPLLQLTSKRKRQSQPGFIQDNVNTPNLDSSIVNANVSQDSLQDKKKDSENQWEKEGEKEGES